jgi:carboxypeptidase D
MRQKRQQRQNSGGWLVAVLAGVCLLGLLFWLSGPAWEPTDAVQAFGVPKTGVAKSQPASKKAEASGQVSAPGRGGRAAVPPAGSSGLPIKPLRPSKIVVVDSTPRGTRVSFSLGDYAVEETEYSGQHACQVHLEGFRSLKVKDAPVLPSRRSTLVIPDGTAPELRILSIETEELACSPPVPSAGFVSRRVAGMTTRGPPQFGSVYSGTVPFPREVASLGEPFKIRQVRGVGLNIYPFQYDPARGVLRIVKSLELEVMTAPSQDGATLSFPAPFRNGEFRRAGRRLFDNFTQAFRGETSTTEDSESTLRSVGETTLATDDTPDFLIIVPDAWTAELANFVLWKRQRGMRVSVAGYPTDTGEGTDAITSYIQTSYDQDAITHVLLVGDNDDLPATVQTVAGESIPSDTAYTLTSGDDYYHDLFISRISASAVADLQNQLGKIIAYEKSPQTDGAWYGKAMMVASAEGGSSSEFGLKDYEQLDLERNQLLTYGYTQIDQIYDPGAASTEVTTAWNAGRGLVYYLGHGTETAWTTTTFDVEDAVALSNGSALPFVMNGNCLNGNFTRSEGDCLAEAMMKTGSAAEPAGSIGVISATTEMDWDPPIVVMQAFTEYLTGETAFTAGNLNFDSQPQVITAGGLNIFSTQRGMEYCTETNYYGEGDEAAQRLMLQTHLFGDCTLSVRTQVPVGLVVDHPEVAFPNASFVVTVKNAALEPLTDATVCLYDGTDVQLVGSSDSSGQVSLTVGDLSLESITLTVFAADAVPYQAVLPITDGSLTIISQSMLTAGAVGGDYEFLPSATGGTAPYQWSVLGTLPDGLEISSETGQLSGTPTVTGTFSFQFQVSDGDGDSDTQSVSLTLGNAVTLNDTALPTGIVDVPYSHTLAAEGTFSPFRYELAEGELPSGLSLSTDGVLSGTPLRAGSFSLTIAVADTLECSDSRVLTLQVESAETLSIMTDAELPEATRTEYYEVELAAEGGSGGGFVWQLVSGSLPEGVTLTDGGLLSGTPTLEGDYSFTLQVTDDAVPPCSASCEFALTVVSSVYFKTSELADVVAGSVYSVSLEAGGGSGPFEFSESTSGLCQLPDESNSFSAVGERQDWAIDEHEWDLELGFSFPFYGETYTSCRVGDNGYLIFGDSSPRELWNADSDVFANYVMIAPFWTDLDLSQIGDSEGIFIQFEAEQVTVRWRGPDYHDLTELNFSATLASDGSITFRYGDIETSNRVVIGVSGGVAASSVVIDSHVWSENNPTTMTGWSNHDDICWAIPESLPDWLTLTSDGQLSGTPSGSGTWTFTINLADSTGDIVSQKFTLTVVAPVLDLDDDGGVDNDELLIFLDYADQGLISEAEAQEAIERWQSTATVARSQRDALVSVAPVSRLGTISICQVEVATQAELDDLSKLGFDVAGWNGAVATIYVSSAELTWLKTAGYEVQVIESQQVPGPMPDEVASDAPTSRSTTGYHTYTTLTEELEAVVAAYPMLCQLVSIGQSVQGRELWALKISDNPEVDEAEPEVRLLGTMHGDEPPGMEMSLRLISFLLDNYGGLDEDGQRATALVDANEIWLVPCLNPDGLVAGTRYNANGIDLNRAFPDGVEEDLGNVLLGGVPDASSREAEVAAVMAWSADRRFALSANLHTGSLVVCYPYGNNAENESVDTPSPDDLLFESLALTYAQTNPQMAASTTFTDGIINSADWYAVNGEMPDWNYRYLGTLALTMELDTVKNPDATLLNELWTANQEALLAFLERAGTGVCGAVTDADSGSPLAAEIAVAPQGHAIFAGSAGDYQRILLPGTHQLEVAADGHWIESLGDIAVADGSVTTRDASLTAAPHRVCRKFAGHAAENTLAVTLEVALDEAELPAAFILTEELPSGCDYLSGSTLVDGAAEAIPLRLDGETVSWLFRGDSLRDFQLSYAVAYPDDAEVLYFSGRYESVPGDIPVLSESRWTRSLSCILDLEAGWNLVSLPMVLTSASLELLQSAIVNPAWGWNGASYEEANSFTPMQGYWLYALEATSLSLAGTHPVQTQVELSQGWNLIGPLAAQSLPENDAICLPIWSWQDGAYQGATALLPTLAYWLYALEPISLELQ